jgi:hypothetical protein
MCEGTEVRILVKSFLFLTRKYGLQIAYPEGCIRDFLQFFRQMARHYSTSNKVTSPPPSNSLSTNQWTTPAPSRVRSSPVYRYVVAVPGLTSVHCKPSSYTGQERFENRRIHSRLEWDTNPRHQCSSGRRPSTEKPLWSAELPTASLNIPRGSRPLTMLGLPQFSGNGFWYLGVTFVLPGTIPYGNNFNKMLG